MSEPLEQFVPESLRPQRRPLVEFKSRKKSWLLIITIGAILVGFSIGAAVAILEPKIEMSDIASFGAFILVVVAYFIPSTIAHARSHRNALAVAVLNLFLGWTLVGWVVALVWSLYVEAPKES